ncbi:MAG: ubiquinone biosynthesis methyltransferase UbiE [Sulfurovum sp. PC08-66]|nr:MAG: ubiquinone biosynthesis methyltransferase UbiE [Sulfurovum sp. PC08-66]KIM12398.1 MAG: ubiquinone biosynthesis methyltransferase UbiE [Sulfuricurvum sp. PC08-66]
MSNKQYTIVEMFNQIAPTYDRANRVLSFGVDTVWRKKACNKSFALLGEKKVNLIVDVACGTGDMMEYWRRQAKAKGIEVGRIVGIDPSEGMVNVGRQKFPHFDFEIAYATQLPLADASADIVSISYGIRNVLARQEAFGEFNRVLKMGGLVVILEFTRQARPSIMGRVTSFYLNRVLPKIGGFISRNKAAYEYLPNSIEGFVTTETMRDELIAAGFEPLYIRSFSMNISTLFIVKKVR